MDLLSTDTSIFNLLIRSDDTIIIEFDNEILREYAVTLKKYEDLDAFYNNMETIGGDLYIPNRQVVLSDRRPISRNTHYLLTQFEAEELKKDPRVEDVDLTYTEKGLEIKPIAVQYSNSWSKQSNAASSSKNWALLRSFNGYTTAGWGSDGTTTAAGTINITNTGKNVDVVICDGHITNVHPEFAVNIDGSGGTRVVQYNWFQHNVAVKGANSAGTYQYTFPTLGSNDSAHGTHIAGVVAGNTQGWASSANIYNINPYPYNNDNAASDVASWPYYVIDYIRAFHNSKPINPVTGVKNPTIVNLSWELITSKGLPTITKIQFQGSTFNQQPPIATYWNAFKNYLGLISSTSDISFGVRDSALDADIADGLAAGIIFVGGAGNYSMYNDVSTGTNFNNALYITPTTLAYYHRGSSPAAADGVINVSSIDSTTEEKKAGYSNAGPRTDIFAPGTLIVSSWYGTSGTPAVDPRNIAGTTYLSTYSGTSVASAQVAGVLACALETYPRMTYTEAKEYLQAYATKDQLSTPPNGTEFGQPAIFSNINGILGGPNLYLKFNKEKLDYAETYPKQNYKQRPTSSRTYPRVKRRLRG